MGIIAKSSIKTSVALYIGVLLGTAIRLYFFPKFLSSAEIGIIDFITSASLLVLPILILGLPLSIVRFGPLFEQSPLHFRVFITLSLFLPVVMFSLILLPVFGIEQIADILFGTRASEFRMFFPEISVLAIIIAYREILRGISRHYLSVFVPKLADEVIQKAFVIGTVTLFGLKLISWETAVWFYVLAFLFSTGTVLAHMVKKKWLLLSFSFANWQKPMMKGFKGYTLFSVFQGSYNLFVVHIDTIMVTLLLGFAPTGIYSIAFFIGAVVEIPARSIGMISTPLISKAWVSGETKSIQSYYSKASLVNISFGALTLGLIWANIDALFQIIPNGSIYSTGKYVVLIIGLSRLINMGFGINNEILSLSNYYRFNFYVVFFLIGFVVLFNYLLIPIYGIMGAALASLCSYLLFNLCRFLLVWKFLGMQPFSNKTVLPLIYIGASIALASFIDMEDPFFEVALKSLLIISVYLPALYLTNISPDVNQQIGRGLKLLRFK